MSELGRKCFCISLPQQLESGVRDARNLTIYFTIEVCNLSTTTALQLAINNSTKTSEWVSKIITKHQRKLFRVNGNPGKAKSITYYCKRLNFTGISIKIYLFCFSFRFISVFFFWSFFDQPKLCVLICQVCCSSLLLCHWITRFSAPIRIP